MTQKIVLRTLCLLAILLLASSSGAMAQSSGQPSMRAITLSLPAETVLQSVQKLLPLAIPSNTPELQGDIILQSLESLAIQNNTLFVHGLLTGKNLTVTTNIAGQNLQMKVGQLQLPLRCKLYTRFDPSRRVLWVKPQFSDNTASQNPDNSAASLLGALDGREFAINLNKMQTLNLMVGDQSIPVTMRPVDIVGKNNTLIVQLLPLVHGRR